ncbi:hypothetical protein BASA81_000082 [Batrachochytrium salamandrivorans]|nr:hypothetical protein BASA81_000082 [Batrachochytrium salamandrivorans]
MFSLLRLLLVLVAVVDRKGAVASLPPSLFYSATVRSFIAQGCRMDYDSTEIGINRRDTYCPKDAQTRLEIENGTLRGHIDFERVYTPSLYPWLNGETRPFNSSKYARFGQTFPVVAGTEGVANPAVTTELQYGTTGVPKMIYCSPEKSLEEGYACDSGDYNRTVNNSESFSTWYEDSRLYNRRMGYQQKLTLKNSQYQYSSGTTISDYFDPIHGNNLTDKAWALSNQELGYGGHKYWFTLEIHTSFQYYGTEVFSFSGDDDVHVYFNGILGVCIGGVHELRTATIELKQYARELNLTVGQVYQFDMFHAERQTLDSNFAMTTTLAETCNVVTSKFRTNGADVELAVDWTANGNTSNSDWEVVAGPGWGYFEPPKTMVLMAPNVPNAVGYMFYKSNQVNVGSGFSFKFEFQMTGGAGNGFAVLFHNRELGLLNFNGGTGPNLGIKNNDNSFAVVFDVTNPNRQELGVHYNVHGDRRNSMSNATKTVYDPDVIQNWKDGTWHSVEVMYYETPDWLEVYLDNSLRLRERNFSMINVIGGRNAHIGFSASSGDNTQYLTTKIRNVALTAVKVVSRNTVSNTVLPVSGTITAVADGRDKASFQISTRDACLKPVQFGGLAGWIQGRMRAPAPAESRLRRVLQYDDEYEEETFVEVHGVVTDLQNGAYQVDFSATQALANASVFLAFGEACEWNEMQYSGSDCWQTEFPQSVTFLPYLTQSPTQYTGEKLPGVDWTILIATGSAMGVITCCFMWFICGGLRSRQQWQHDRVFIEGGRIAVAERGLQMEGCHDLEVLQEKLQCTIRAVQRERAMKFDAKAGEIERLLFQRGELQEIIRRLKLKKAGLDPNDPNVDDSFLEIMLERARKSLAELAAALRMNKPGVKKESLIPPSSVFFGDEGVGAGWMHRLNDVSLQQPSRSVSSAESGTTPTLKPSSSSSRSSRSSNENPPFVRL